MSLRLRLQPDAKNRTFSFAAGILEKKILAAAIVGDKPLPIKPKKPEDKPAKKPGAKDAPEPKPTGDKVDVTNSAPTPPKKAA